MTTPTPRGTPGDLAGGATPVAGGADPTGAASYVVAPIATPVLVRLAVASAVLLVLGLCLARPDLVALGAPFALALVLAVAHAHGTRVGVSFSTSRREVVEGREVHGQVVVRASGDLDALTISVGTGPGVVVQDGLGSRTVVVRGGEEAVVDLGLLATRWGRSWVGPVRVSAATAGLAYEVVVPVQPLRHLVVLPRIERFPGAPALQHAITAAGTHRSAARGDGLDFAGIRPFVYGDRLRRVSWRVTSRLGSLHVVEAFTERASEIVVLVDSAQDVGESDGPAGRSSSLDHAVRAAASITSHHLGRGDTVRLVDVGRRVRFLRPVSSRRDVVAVLEWLLDTRLPEAGAVWAPYTVAGHVPPRAVAIALTPLLDHRMTALVARLRQRGQPVVVVDTLPGDAVPATLDEHEQLGYRLWMLEREQTVALLEEHGCPVVRWGSPHALDAAIGLAARSVRRPAGVGVRT